MTELFEYISIFLSIVIALGMAELVAAWGELLRNRRRVSFYWLHSFWSVYIIVMMVQFWLGLWDYRAKTDWSMIYLSSLVFQNLILVLLAQMMAPKLDLSRPANMRDFFFENSKVFFLLAAALMATVSFNDILQLGQSPFHTENLLRGGGLIVCVTAAFQINPRVHTAVALLATALFIAFVALGQ